MEIQGEEVSSAETFIRLEDKFLIPRGAGEKLLATLSDRMDPSYPDPTTLFTRMASLYFDSAEFSSYLSHFSGAQKRFKLRVRKYFPNGCDSGEPSWLELKSKEEGVSKKFRFCIGKHEESQILQGKGFPLSEELLALNPGMKPGQLAKRIGKINSLIETYGLRPRMTVEYIRRAFERDGFRVTMDEAFESRIWPGQEAELRGLSFPIETAVSAAEMAKTFSAQEQWIVELKHQGVIPEWMSEFLCQQGASEASFSKYCFSITQALERLRGRLVA